MMADLASFYHVIRRPLFTEKVSYLQERDNTYAFEVAAGANKVQIRQAVETIWGVHVESVRTQTVPGKYKRFGVTVGKTATWKKALVKVREGDAIQLF
jgi:large subunit ribosomal protein L23